MDKPANVEEYMVVLPAEPRAALESLRATIHSAAPDATETISYSLPTFKLDGRPLMAYGAFKNHCSLFPMSSRLIADFAGDLEPFPTAKGTIRFQPDRPLPKGLVRKLVAARVRDIRS